jgi:hypothetical protein
MSVKSGFTIAMIDLYAIAHPHCQPDDLQVEVLLSLPGFAFLIFRVRRRIAH